MQLERIRFDLAWMLLLAKMFCNPEVREIFLGGYEQSAGHRTGQ
jgi:hypothetical protein